MARVDVLVRVHDPAASMANPPIDVARAPARSRSAIDGEVRFDAVSRALYSTDASVYQIEPLGVVVVEVARGRRSRASRSAASIGCPLTMRGGGTSQAGQAIGAGLQIDTSKYFNRLLEVNVEERWARVEPGIVLDELNAALRPHGLRFAPDISTASRATVGGMMANNSSGARSVLYGKTIDHVLEQDVVLVRRLASRTSGRSTRAELDAICARRRRSKRACYRDGPATGARRTPTRSSGAFRRCCGGSAATTSTRSSTPAQPFNLREADRRLRGHARRRLEAKVSLVPLPTAKAVLAIQFADLLDALAATPADPARIGRRRSR